jgi:hypothetical protein
MAGGAVVGGLDSDPGFAEQTALVNIGRDIFFDLAWQHEAFLETPDEIVALAELHDQFNQYPSYAADGTVTYAAGSPKQSYKAAWEKIVSGDPAQVADGNRDLLANEQWSIVQPGYDFFRTTAFSGLPTPFTNNVHPYHRAFIVEKPQGDILAAEDRWDWITRGQGMWDQWVAAGADERNRLVQVEFDRICRGDFGEPGRPDLLPPGGP